MGAMYGMVTGPEPESRQAVPARPGIDRLHKASRAAREAAKDST
jgi:hypothetical protein